MDKAGEEAYLENLYIRFIEGEMIKGYYRNIWRGSDEVVDRITERTKLYRQFVSQQRWNQITRRHPDLELDRGYLKANELAEEPIVSILLWEGMTSEEYDLVLGSIYNQQFQRFEVLVSEDCFNKLGEDVKEYRQKPNFKVIQTSDDYKKKLVHMSKGRYIAIIDSFAMYTKNSILNMERKLDTNTDIDFVSMLLKSFDGNDYSTIEILSAEYGYTRSSKRRYIRASVADNMFANKLLRKELLEDYEFSDKSVDDIEKLCKAASFERMRKGIMIVKADEGHLYQNDHLPLSVKLKASVNEGISRMINLTKKKFNKEDISKIKRLVGRE